jgi:hypothetical protein
MPTKSIAPKEPSDSRLPRDPSLVNALTAAAALE